MMAQIEAGLFARPAKDNTGKLTLFQRLALWRSRRALLDLDDRALTDVGLTRAQAEREARLPVWDVPASWRSK